MDNNIFMEDQKPLSFEQYLQYDEKSRSNLGETLPVLVYRMLEYSMKDELVSRLGKDVLHKFQLAKGLGKVHIIGDNAL